MDFKHIRFLIKYYRLNRLIAKEETDGYYGSIETRNGRYVVMDGDSHFWDYDRQKNVKATFPDAVRILLP